MVRTPSLPASVFSDFVQFEGNDVENFLQQTPFRDFMDKSILLSSRELYNAKKRNLQSSTKKSKARNLARIKFLIRACTRPTPYGLFAGAALGEFCENPNIEPMVIDERKAILECRADYSWLSHFIYEMENNPSVYPQLQLRFNNNCYVSGDRLKNPHHSNHGFLMPEETVTERTHMRNTPLITYVKQQAQTFIRYDLLKSRIQSKYPGVPEEKIISTINALMENEVLLSNLRAPANCENGLEYVLKILAPIEGIDRQKETLQKINTLINQMNGELEIDQVNAKTIESVYTLMDGLLSQKNEKDLLAVNKGMVLQQNKLPYQVKEIVEQFVEALTYLQVDVPSRLEKFKRQFQEEYGSNVEVPFCTIIDQNDFNGLSYLEKYQPSQDEKDQKIKQIVDEKILDCLQAQQEEINLSIDNFSSLEISREDRYPESFDINFFVSKEKEHYRLWLAPIGGSGAAGDMFNRFNCVLDADLFHQYKENNRSLVCSDKALITVEIREGSVKGRMSNVNNHRNESQYYIALATNDDNSNAEELPLDDLLIGMQYNQLYIKSKRLGKRCKVRQNCMVNPSSLSEVSQLLMQISSDEETSVIARAFQLFQNDYVFLPRISLEDVVVFPKRWNLPLHLFALHSQESFEESFQKLRRKYTIDDIVYLSEGDRRLALNLDKAYNLLNYFIKKYDNLYKKFNQQDAAIAKETMVKMTSLSIIEQIITGAIFAYIIYCGFIGGILLGDVVAYTRAAISNQTNIQSILQNISSIKKSNLYIGQYYSFIDLENAKTLDEGKIIIDKIHSLKLENLSFKYDTGGYVLKNVNFEFKEGNSYAIVGKNGSGKTTLAKLLMGLYDNYEGNIYVNGIELRSIHKEHYSKRIASLFQDFIKYDATFRENIAYGNLDLMDKDAELRDLSNEFRIGHIIDHSKQNLDTQLGYWFDEGKQISFGEWQKLAIARTFSKDADVIFLDEPNSALDAISDYEISQLYQKLFQDKMGIIIAHKFNNLINQVNNILVIENGRLAESGTHTDLLHQGKIYYEMYQLQNKNSAVL